MFSRLLSPLRAAGHNAARRMDLLATLVLVLCVWALHGHGLTLGFWFDDHNHLELCRKNGFSDLAGGNRFDWTGHITHVWWAQKGNRLGLLSPSDGGDARSSSFDAFGLNPLPFHVVHLTLFSLSVVLFYGLLRRCGWGPPRVLARRDCSSSCIPPTPSRRPGSPTTAPSWSGCGCWWGCGCCTPRRGRAIAGSTCWPASSCVTPLALLSRENGVMVGPLLLLFDFVGARRLDGGRTDGRDGAATRRGSGAAPCTPALALEGLAFLPFRAWSLGAVPLPRSPVFSLAHGTGILRLAAV